MQIGFDFGGSLIKLSISYIDDCIDGELLKDIENRITNSFSEGKRKYLNILFMREEFGFFINFLKHIQPHINQAFVVCTGGGVCDKRVQLQEALKDIELEPLAEFKSIIDGIGYFAKIIPNFIYTLNYNLEKVNLQLNSLYPFLLANIGTGISLNRVDINESTYLCGTSMGGTSLLGFARFFDKNTDFEQLLKHCEDNSVLFNEEWIFETAYEALMEEETVPPLVPSIFQGIVVNICTIAYLVAKKHKITYAMFIGNFMKNNELARNQIRQEFAKLSHLYDFTINVSLQACLYRNRRFFRFFYMSSTFNYS